MADSNYIINPNPTYDPAIRALQDSDPAHASTVFNPLIEKIVNNVHAVKLAGDDLATKVETLEEKSEDAGSADNIKLENGKTVEEAFADVETSKAGLVSPVFTGAPKAPTAATGSNDTTIATTEFVKKQGYVTSGSPTFTGTPKAPTPSGDSNDTSIATTAFVKGQGFATTVSPTLTGEPKAPTPAAADSSTKVATTAFVKNQGYSPLASPVFTGAPKAPTPAAASNDTTIATTAFVKAAIGDIANGLFQLAITFSSDLSGKAFSVAGGGFTYNGTVPAGLAVTVAVPKPNTTYTVTCNGNAKNVVTTNYFGIYSLTVESISTTFANNTWAQIAAVAEAGNASSYWSVGAEKNITLTNGEVLTLQIYGFNHDDKAGGGKAGITFGLKNLMTDTRQMNTSNTNSGGFTSSALYSWLTTDLYNLLPSDLKPLIKSVNKKTSAGSQSSTINTNAMKVFLFSEVECFGTTTYSAAGEGTQYPIFTDNTSRIKKLQNGAGSAHWWWERSPYTGNSTYFCLVYSDGGASSNAASSSYGVCFGFCI